MNNDFSSKQIKSIPIQNQAIIPVYWQNSHSAQVYWREVDNDEKILNLAQSEVNIQYRYGSDFKIKSVVGLMYCLYIK